jgi:hypothetical protein
MRYYACKNRDKCLIESCRLHTVRSEYEVKEFVTACPRAEFEEVNLGGTIEVDAHDIAQHEPGAKLDKGKPDVGLVFASFPDAICLVAEVSSFGEKKYSLFGWESVPDALRRYWSALGRHLLACSKGLFMKQFVRDPESGINELASVAWNALAVLQKSIEYEREHEDEL